MRAQRDDDLLHANSSWIANLAVRYVFFCMKTAFMRCEKSK